MVSAQLIYFSPTHTTATILQAIAEGFGAAAFRTADITFSPLAKSEHIPELTIIGAPVYAGRLPEVFVDRLAGLQGNGKQAVIVVVYGNREYEDALLELAEIVQTAGFSLLAASAFIGEHSYSTAAKPIAEGRPDSLDIQKAKLFGSSIHTKFANNDISLPKIPGNTPYKILKPMLPVSPETAAEVCIKCFTCISVCPVQAIPKKNPAVTESSLCIHCSACIKACPVQARTFTDQRMLDLAERLYRTCTIRKEPEMYL